MSEIRKLNCGLRVVDGTDSICPVGDDGNMGEGRLRTDEDDSCRGMSEFSRAHDRSKVQGGPRTARQIASDADALGAQMNAFTSKESTCYYIKSLTSNVDKACEILIDMMTEFSF